MCWIDFEELIRHFNALFCFFSVQTLNAHTNWAPLHQLNVMFISWNLCIQRKFEWLTEWIALETETKNAKRRLVLNQHNHIKFGRWSYAFRMLKELAKCCDVNMPKCWECSTHCIYSGSHFTSSFALIVPDTYRKFVDLSVITLAIKW